MCVAVGGAVGGPGENCPEAKVSSVWGAADCGVVAWPSALGDSTGAVSNMGKRAENSRRFIGPRIRGQWYAMQLAVCKWACESVHLRKSWLATPIRSLNGKILEKFACQS